MFCAGSLQLYRRQYMDQAATQRSSIKSGPDAPEQVLFSSNATAGGRAQRCKDGCK